jgi:three-Cys-motif partner protein
MTVPGDVTWPCEPHTRAKHKILKRYLERWFPILNIRHGRIIYIDGFSGPGRYTSGELGSPLIALEVAAKHRKALTGELLFVFIDERADRIEHLRAELKQMNLPKDFKVHPETGKFQEKLKELLDDVDRRGETLAPTFAFIDPFGFSGIPYDLVRRLLEKRSCEVLITFMADSINRWLEHPNESTVSHIPETFGTDECLQITKGAGDRVDALRDLYQRQLKKVARFVRYFEMRDRDDRVIYYLFFAGNHPLGHRKMKEAMFDVGKEGLYRFSDATNPNQLVLFGADHTVILWSLMREQFAGKEFLTDRILDFVNDDTAFLETHMKSTLKKHEGPGVPKNQKIQVRAIKEDGKVRRPGTFPRGVFVTFPG